MKRRIIIFLLAVLTVLVGCERRELEYGSASLSLQIKVNLNVKVNGKIQNLPTPEMMRVLFFDANTYELVTESYLPAGGGRIAIPAGRYKFIGYNFDTEATLIKNDRDYNSIEAYTNEVSSALKASLLAAIHYGKTIVDNEHDGDSDAWEIALKKVQEGKVIYEPDHLFVCQEDVVVENTDTEQVIETEAESIVETWHIAVRLKNRQYLSSARALLTGQIASNMIGKHMEEGKTDTDVTLMFDMGPGSDDENNDVVVGTFNTFGKNPKVESILWLTLRTTGGETVIWRRDITAEFFTELALTNKAIYIEEEITIPVPTNPGGGGGGFQPGVDDWKVVDVPINI